MESDEACQEGSKVQVILEAASCLGNRCSSFNDLCPIGAKFQDIVTLTNSVPLVKFSSCARDENGTSQRTHNQILALGRSESTPSLGS